MPSDKNVIALWGPSGSGKTWLVESFLKSLRLLDHDEDTDWEYASKIADTDDDTFLAMEAPPVEPTLGPQTQDYLVTRRPKLPTSLRAKTVINTHTHRLQVRDIQGDWTWNRDSQDANVQLTTSVNFEGATAVIIALDHTLIKGYSESQGPARQNPPIELSSPQDDIDYTLDEDNNRGTTEQDDIDYTSEENYNGGASREDWVDRVRSLATELRKTKKEFRIAICVTKIDQCNVRQWDASQVIESLYGPRMKELITDLGKYFSVKEFCVSSAGFLADNMETPNFDQATAEIRDEDNWRPYNVHAPFFWIFEEQERKRLADQGNWLAKLLFREHRLRMHAPYPRTDV